MIFTTEEVITATLKVFSFITEVILATEEVVSVGLLTNRGLVGQAPTHFTSVSTHK